MSGIVGIIAEYNPFHNGHYYHIQKSKELSCDDSVVAVISGNFTQRGEPSIINKWSKAYMAICGGADLVIELPTVYAISSAENFASGAIKILDSMKIVDSVSFGAEARELSTLNNIANVLCEEPKQYLTILAHELDKGISYAKARENAILMYLNDIKRYANILNSPNNILAIEYLKAIKKIRSNIEPVMVQRKKVYYNDEKIVDEFASSTGVRKLLENREFSEIQKVIPRSSYKILANDYNHLGPVLGLKCYEKEIIYILRRMSIEQIANLPDVAEGLEYAIKKAVSNTNSIEELIDSVKSKRYTQTRIQRILLYALLGIDKQIMETSKKITPYIRVLGFTQRGKALLSEMKKINPKLKIITSVKKFEDEENNKQLKMLLNIDKYATDVYTEAYKEESKANLDYTNNLIITN